MTSDPLTMTANRALKTFDAWVATLSPGKAYLAREAYNAALRVSDVPTAVSTVFAMFNHSP